MVIKIINNINYKLSDVLILFIFFIMQEFEKRKNNNNNKIYYFFCYNGNHFHEYHYLFHNTWIFIRILINRVKFFIKTLWSILCQFF